MILWEDLPVAWFTLHDEQPARGFWDQATLEDQLGRLGASQFAPEAPGGSVVVLPGRMNYGRENELQAALAGFEWVVLVVTSDEEGGFDHTAVGHPRIERHVQTPTRPLGGARFVPLGSTPHLRDVERGPDVRPYDWAFVGQITHDRRDEALAVCRRWDRPGLLATTDRFGAGLPPHLYAETLTHAKVVLCPSGPVHPETFRMYEALEAGCLPVADRRTPGADWSWWWEEYFPDPPFPVVTEWRHVRDLVDLDGWQRSANRAGAWWARRKLAHGDLILADAENLAGRTFQPDVERLITVVVTVSPIPSNPSTAIVQETVASITARRGIFGCRIVLACDGVRPEQDHMRDAYQQAVAELIWMSHHDKGWENVSVVVADEWQHQANLTRLALDEVRTPVVLFMEQDTPLVGDDIPWEQLAAPIVNGTANAVRLHHEAAVLPDHRHLMLGDGPSDLDGILAWRTMQWSQRPHLASTAWYRSVLAEFFPTSGRTMIEDYLHGIVQDRPWEWSKVWLYAPTGDMKRSTHLDGRAGQPKYDMRLS